MCVSTCILTSRSSLNVNCSANTAKTSGAKCEGFIANGLVPAFAPLALPLPLPFLRRCCLRWAWLVLSRVACGVQLQNSQVQHTPQHHSTGHHSTGQHTPQHHSTGQHHSTTAHSTGQHSTTAPQHRAPQHHSTTAPQHNIALSFPHTQPEPLPLRGHVHGKTLYHQFCWHTTPPHGECCRRRNRV